MVEGVNKKIVYDFEASTFEMRPKDFTELEEIVAEDTNLKSGTYIVQFVRNGMTIQIKSQRQFESFIIDEPNESGVHKITITRTDDRPKPKKPSTDMYDIPAESMTAHIRDNVDPYWKAIASGLISSSLGKCLSKHLIFVFRFRYKDS